MTLLLSRQTKKSLILLSFIVLSSLFFFQLAQAEGGEGPGGLMSGAETETTVSGKGLLALMFAPLGNAIIALITIILQVLLLVAQISLDIAVGLLIWITHPDFISLSYTNPAGNPLLATGWTLVRNLTNMGFVISFAFIGLATALRIKEYQAQKILLPLILMALLVNFTPVILGVIVDASNILMNFLLGEVVSLQFIADMWRTQGNIVLEQLRALIGDTINYQPLAATIALIIFAGTTSFIIALYALLFLFRYVAIWILVILSPLAFFSYVLPATRKIWQQWWNQFLQWCFIGVTMAFFLYLGNHLLAAATEGEITGILPSSEEAGGLIETLLPYGMVIVLLIYGLLMSLSTSAVGASYAIKGAKKGGKAALKAGATVGKRVGRRAGVAVAEPVAERFKGWGERLRKKAEEAAPPEAGRWQKASWGVARGIGGISETIGKGIGVGVSRLAVGRREEVEEYTKKLEKFTPKELKDRYLPGIPQAKKIAIATLLARKKGSKGLSELKGKEKEAATLASTISPEHMKEIVGTAHTGLTNIEEIATTIVDKKDPRDEEDLAKLAGITVDEVAKKGVKELIPQIKELAYKRMVQGLKRVKIADLSFEILKNPKFLKEFVLSKDVRDFEQVREHHGQSGLDELKRMMKKLGAEKIAPENMALLRAAIFTPLGRELLPALKGAKTAKEIEQLGITRAIKPKITIPSSEEAKKALREQRKKWEEEKRRKG